MRAGENRRPGFARGAFLGGIERIENLLGHADRLQAVDTGDLRTPAGANRRGEVLQFRGDRVARFHFHTLYA